MMNDDTLAKALASVRQKRERLEVEYGQLGIELTKLRHAERSLASIVDGTPLNEQADDEPQRRRAASVEEQPRASRGPRGPRANSAKGRLKTLLEGAGKQGLSHAQISERLHDVSPNTLATYLSTMTSSGELERNGDFFCWGTSAQESYPSNDEVAEADYDINNDSQASE
jgi:hypothetical protein